MIQLTGNNGRVILVSRDKIDCVEEVRMAGEAPTKIHLPTGQLGVNETVGEILQLMFESDNGALAHEPPTTIHAVSDLKYTFQVNAQGKLEQVDRPTSH